MHRPAELARDAAHIEFAGPDLALDATPAQPYGSSFPVGKVMAGEMLLAWSMNGQALPAEHGAPVRIVVPDTSVPAASNGCPG